MNTPTRAGSILAALAFLVSGCDPAEPSYEGDPEKISVPAYGTLGPPAPPPAVVPSPVPSLPTPGSPATKPATPEGDRQGETKPNNRNADPKNDTPR